MKTYTTVIEIDADTQEYIITFPEEIIKELNWKEGDTLNWEVTDSKQVIVTKVKDGNSMIVSNKIELRSRHWRKKRRNYSVLCMGQIVNACRDNRLPNQHSHTTTHDL